MQKSVSILLLAAAALCAQTINDQNTPPHPPRPPSIANIQYGPHEMNDLDLYIAKSDKPTPLVMYFFPEHLSSETRIRST